jgi:TAT (twin-arginine translocation) pathway signal sequence
MSEALRMVASACPRRIHTVIEVAAGDDRLLYDEALHRAYCLKLTVAAVWDQCDGETRVDQMIGAEDETIRHALAQLTDDGLITGMPASDPLSALSRRTFMRAGGAAAAGLVLASTIESIVIPTPAAAASAFPGNSGSNVPRAIDPGGGGSGGGKGSGHGKG